MLGLVYNPMSAHDTVMMSWAFFVACSLIVVMIFGMLFLLYRNERGDDGDGWNRPPDDPAPRPFSPKPDDSPLVPDFVPADWAREHAPVRTREPESAGV